MTALDDLRRRLDRDPDVEPGSLETRTDTVLSIGQDIARLRWRRRPATAVASDADLHTTCGAFLDALALLEAGWGSTVGDPAPPASGEVHVLIARPAPGPVPTETDQATRSMRDAVSDGGAHLWYVGEDDGWVEDLEDAPRWQAGHSTVTSWVRSLLLPRLTATPTAFARDLVAAVDDPSLHLYPSAINSTRLDRWALRVDGLQIGIADADGATLKIGAERAGGNGPQRRTFGEVFGRPSVRFTLDGSGHDELDLAAGAALIVELLQRFRGHPVRGAPLTHRSRDGRRVVDEHTVEARLLKRLIELDPLHPAALVHDDAEVARGSQFPTSWGHDGPPRYLDAMLRRDRTPVAVELKVSTGGQGRYYRRSLVQAVLYRHFILNAPDLDPWFERAALDRTSIVGVAAIPIPERWTERFNRDLEGLRRIGERVGIEVAVVDDRAAPDWIAVPDLPEPNEQELEVLSWRLAAALSTIWSKSLGRVLETHGAGGFYDELLLQPRDHLRFDARPATARISLNRPGSLWVFSPLDQPRWTWREIWNHLHAGADPITAAEIIGNMAGLGRPQPGPEPTFPQMAAEFLDAAPTGPWRWRCAWTAEGGRAPWAERYRGPLRAYGRTRSGSDLPTIARIWGAFIDDEAAVVVDQDNHRVWVQTAKGPVELLDPDPHERIAHAARLVPEHGDVRTAPEE